MQTKKTLVLGASENPNRYSFLAVQNLLAHHHPVIAIGKKAGKVHGIDILSGKEMHDNIDTVTLYLNASNQKTVLRLYIVIKPQKNSF